MITNQRIVQIFIAVMLGLGITVSSHAALVIDNFEGHMELAAIDGVSPDDDYATVGLADDIDADGVDPEILGGERDAFVTRVLSFAGNLVRLTADLPGADPAFNNVLSYSEGSGSEGNATITWDGDDADWDGTDAGGADEVLTPTGLGGVDLTQAGMSTGLDVKVVFDGDIDTDMSFTIYTDATHYSTLTFLLDSADDNDNAIVNFAYDDFLAGSGAAGPVDFTDVGAIVMGIDVVASGSIDSDLTLDYVETHMIPVVPVPAAVWSAMPLLAGLGWLRRYAS